MLPLNLNRFFRLLPWLTSGAMLLVFVAFLLNALQRQDIYWEHRLKAVEALDRTLEALPKERIDPGLLAHIEELHSDVAPAPEVRQLHIAARREMIARWMLALVLVEVLLLTLLHFGIGHIKRLIASHRAALEQERDASEDARLQLQLAMESSKTGFWEWDIVQDKVSFSPHWRRIFGITNKKSLDTDINEWLSRIHPADVSACRYELRRHLDGETTMYEHEQRLRDEQGHYHWLLTRGRIIYWQNDKPARMIGVYTDISEQKNNEVKLLRQQAALNVLNEVAAIRSVDRHEQLRQALHISADFLGMPLGVVSQIHDNDYRVFVQDASKDFPVRNGQHIDLAETYCQLMLEHGDVLAIDHVGVSRHSKSLAYRTFAMESYIGAPLWVEGQVCGSVSFASDTCRLMPFDKVDRDFMLLLARWISSVLTRWHHESERLAVLERFTKLSDHLPGFLFQLQLCPDGTSFFPYASPGVRHIFGVTPDTIGKDTAYVLKRIHPDDAANFQQSIQLSASTLKPWFESCRVIHPVYGQIWIQGVATPELLEDKSVLWHGFISDITEIKETEAAFQRASILRKAILDAASIAIISVDPKGIIQTFNRGAEKMLGYTAEELIGEVSLVQLHDPGELAGYAERLGKPGLDTGFDALVAVAREGRADENEWSYIGKSGLRISVLLTVTALRDGAGRTNGFLAIARDITERKRVEQMKNEFIATVSHELRTPLTAISGALGLIEGGVAGELPDKAHQMVVIAHRNSQRLKILVDDLLDMEKLVAGKIRFDIQQQLLVPLVQQSMEANADFASQYQVQYRLQDGADDAWVRVDAHRLQQVLTNFLSNAAKFSPAGGVVTVAVRRTGERIRVVVTDTGPGIPENFRDRIFQKFSQADSSDNRQKGGTGLGLAICKELIEKMQGLIGFDSVPGRGASFYFELNCQTEPETQVSPVAANRRS